MTVRLGEILVKSGASSEEAVRDALKNQIIFGGRLGTNLLEIEAVTEEALAKALGKQHGVPCAFGPTRPDPAAVALLSPEIADRCDAVPLRLRGRRLAAAVVDPRNLAMLDEIAFVTGKVVLPVVAPEARVWALLRESYDIERHLRGMDVDFAHLRRIEAARGIPDAGEAAIQPVAADLMDEGAFSALYEHVMGPVPSQEPRPPEQPPPPPPFGEAPPPASAASASKPPLPYRTTLPLDEVIELTDLIEPEAWSTVPLPKVPPTVAAEILAALSRAPGPAPPARFEAPARPEPEPAPLSFAEAMAQLAGVGARDAIARTVLRYARSKFQRAVLLTVQRGGAHGWAGLGGDRLRPEAIRKIHLALGQPGILDMVVKTQAHFLGPLPKTEANIRLLKAMGGGVPGNALLVPILALGRVVNLFYVDNGKGGMVDSGDVGELLILATRIAKSYDTLLARVR